METPVPPGALAAIGFFVVAIGLWIYAARHWARRRQAMTALMPSLGWKPLANPRADELVPERLFYPDRLLSSAAWAAADQKWFELRAWIEAAWRGRMAGHDVVVMDLSVHRERPSDPSTSSARMATRLNRTVLRCDPPGEDRPPDLLIEEQVLLKGQVRGHLELGGEPRIGRHYFVFSTAPASTVERWIDAETRHWFAEHRLWKIAVHDGVVYLTRNTSWQKPGEMRRFLAEGEALLAAMLHGR